METKQKRIKRNSKPIVSPPSEKISILGQNKSQDTRSKLHSSKDSDLMEFKKTKNKQSVVSSISNLSIEEQIKKEIALANNLLKDCEEKVKEMAKSRSEKEELIQLEEIIKEKNKSIESLEAEIDKLKKTDKNIQEESVQSNNKNTDTSEKERLFKLADQMRIEREDLAKSKLDYVEKHNNYQKIKKLIQQIQQKYTRPHPQNSKQKSKEDVYNGPLLMTYEQFKQRLKNKKQQNTNKAKKIDFYHHLSPQKQANPSKNMKDLITRKNITRDAIKNSKRKHTVEMNELFAKIEFLKDEDILLTQKIRQKQQQLSNMEKKFSERKGEHQRNAINHYRF